VAVLWPLAERLMEQIQEDALTRALSIEGNCLNALAEMELAGMPVDVEHWRQITAAEDARIPLLVKDMTALLNGQGCNLFGEATLEWNSPSQVLTLLQARGHAVENTDADSLKSLKDKDPLIPLLLDYREAAKRVQTYGEHWLAYVDPMTQRVYPEYFQLGSRAGRMSCSKPNIQQIPRASQYRQAIAAPLGRVLLKADYSQIELRIAAAIAKDAKMLQAFHEGRDLHTVTASLVLGIPEQHVTKAHRQIAKSLNFGLLYGMGVKGLQAYAANTFGVSLSDAEAVKHRRRFFQTYCGLQSWHDQTGACLDVDKAIDTRTLAGRRRRQVQKFTECLNTPVQGSGADGLKLALGQLFQHREDASTAKLIGTVHDEIIAECPAEDAEATAAWLQHHMTAPMQALIGETVPVVVDVHHGRTWAGDVE
jgi:DNA polymerase-1